MNQHSDDLYQRSETMNQHSDALYQYSEMMNQHSDDLYQCQEMVYQRLEMANQYSEMLYQCSDYLYQFSDTINQRSEMLKQYNFVCFNDKERVCTKLCITTFPTTVSLYGKLFSKICSDNFHYYTKVWEIFHSPLERGVTHSYKYVSL